MLYLYHVVPPIKARRGEIVIQVMRFIAGEAIEMVLGDLPHVTIEIVKTFRTGRIKIDRLRNKERKILMGDPIKF